VSAASAKSRGLGLKRLSGNTALTFVANIAAMATGLLLSILITRNLGSAGMGTYAVALLLPNTMVTLLEFGMTYSNVYHVARGDVNAREVMRANLWIWGFITVIGLAISALIIYFKGSAWFPGIPAAFMIVAVLSFPPNLLQFYCQAILQGYQDFRRFNYLTVIVKLTTLVVSAVFILVFHLGVGWVIFAFLIGQLLSLLFTLVALRPYLKAAPKAAVHESWWKYGRMAVSYGWKQHLSAVVAFVNYRVDLFFVNLFLAQAVAGVYYIVIQLGEAMWIVSKVVSTVLLPRLAELHNEEQTRLQLTPLITRLVFCFTLAAAIMIALLARPVLSLWHLEPAMAELAVSALFWLLPGIVMGSATRIVAYDFSARGKPEYNSYLAIVVVFINIACNLILIPKYGMVGGAMATTIAYTANTLATVYLYRRFSDLASWKLFVMQPADFVLLRDAGLLGMKKLRSRGDA
jgi:O-antigen/teichoic acid export membrane protein